MSLRPSPRFVSLLGLLVLCACGTSSVSMVVVRPALLNAREHGGTVSIAGFDPAHPDYVEVAGMVGQELAQQVLRSARDIGGVVALREYGGGLVVSGRVEEYAMHLVEGQRAGKCQEKAEVPPGTEIVPVVERDCAYKWFDWRARVAVTMRVTTSTGVVQFLHPIVAERAGRTAEQPYAPPPPPNAHVVLRQLRADVVRDMAQVVVPHKVRVTATFYDCVQPAEAACQAGVAHMAASRYESANQAFTDAIGRLQQAPRDELAKAHWNRAVVFEYSRRFDEAIADYRRAYELDDSSTYREGLRGVERARARHQQLLQQGLGQ